MCRPAGRTAGPPVVRVTRHKIAFNDLLIADPCNDPLRVLNLESGVCDNSRFLAYGLPSPAPQTLRRLRSRRRQDPVARQPDMHGGKFERSKVTSLYQSVSCESLYPAYTRTETTNRSSKNVYFRKEKKVFKKISLENRTEAI